MTSPAIRAENCDASKLGDRADAAAARAERLPVRLGADAERRHEADARHDDSPAQTTSVRVYFFLLMRLDVLDRFLDARDLLGILVGDLDPELLFERHDQLHRVERVGAQVVDERRIRRHFFFVHTQLLHDDALHFVSDGHSALQGSPMRPPLRTRRRNRGAMIACSRFRYIYIPPLTARTCPVIYDASSEARKQTAAATSSGVPSRFSGIRDLPLLTRLLGDRRVMSVSIRPGATTLTVMPREATSSATAFANPIRPAFDAA